MKVTTLLALCIWLGSAVRSQSTAARLQQIEATFPVIDTLFAKQARDHHFPGFVYGLVVDGKLVHTGNIGTINTRQNISASSQSVFRIASMTKSFTAMAILRLRDEGKLKLDDPAYLYIPELKGQKLLTSDAPPITIRHLLTHGAGFPEDNPWGDRQLAISEQDLVAMIKKGISFSNSPGITYEYSNMGFAMLGYIIRKVSGMSYDKYITKNILLPLGMSHTYFEFTDVPAGDLAHGYRWLNDQWEEQPMLKDGIYGAMGGMLTSIEDFSKYVAFHQNAWPPRNDAESGPVKRSSLREMQFPWNFASMDLQNEYSNGRGCPIITAYGYGLRWQKDCGDRIFVGHSGGLPGFGSNWRILPEYGIGIISFSNLTYAPTSYLNLAVLDTVIRLAKLQPRHLPPSKILEQRKNELIRLLPEWQKPETSGIFAENFFLDYFPDSLRSEARAIFSKAGRINAVGEFVPENNLRGYFILNGTNSDIEISFTLTPENPPLIQEYRIRQLSKNK